MARRGEGPENKPKDLTHKFDLSEKPEVPAKPEDVTQQQPRGLTPRPPRDLTHKFDFSDVRVVRHKPRPSSKTKPPMADGGQQTKQAPKAAPEPEEGVEELKFEDLEEVQDESAVEASAASQKPKEAEEVGVDLEGLEETRAALSDKASKAGGQRPKEMSAAQQVIEKDILETLEAEKVKVSEANVQKQKEAKLAEAVVDELVLEAQDASEVEAAMAASRKLKEKEGASAQREVIKAWADYVSAKETFEKIGDEYIERYQTVLQQVNDPSKKYADVIKRIYIHRNLTEDGLLERHTAAVLAFYAAEKAYGDRYAVWEAELAKDLEKSPEFEAAYKRLVSEKEDKTLFNKEEAEWIADVRHQIAGEELEEPVGTPGDLSLLGFDKGFIDTYNSTRERFDKLEAQKLKAGFFKKLFGGKKLEREYEAARGEYETMHEAVVKRRMAHERAFQEADEKLAAREGRKKTNESE